MLVDGRHPETLRPIVKVERVRVTDKIGDVEVLPRIVDSVGIIRRFLGPHGLSELLGRKRPSFWEH